MRLKDNTLHGRIAAMMIVKDNEKIIEKAIKSIIPISSQIVVVDTGSVDNTPAICSRLGAEVYFYKWNNDFSEVRNYGLRFIRRDWIVSLDSDEILNHNTLAEYIHLFNNDTIGGLNVIINNILDDDINGIITTHRYTRIFKNHQNIRFVGKIHEQINDSIINNGFDICETNISIEHYGYKTNDKSKIERNKTLLLDELKQKPNDEWLIYHLAETEFSAGNLTEAKNLYLNIIESKKLSIEQNQKINIRLAQIALKNDEYEELEKWTQFSSNDINIEGLRLYILAAMCLMKHDFINANYLLQSSQVNYSNLVDKRKLADAIELTNKMIQK